MFQTIRRFFPSLKEQFDALPDPRRRELTVYPARALAWSAVLMFLFRLGARRRFGFDLNGPGALDNFNRLAETHLERLPHPDTIAYLLKRMSPSGLDRARRAMAQVLLRSRALERFRLLDKFYLVAIDGTGFLSFSKPHCRHCLTREMPNGNTRYHHPVLEAKLVCGNGLVVSLATEFILNSDGEKKQDCELKAFYRLLPRLRKAFPQLSICLLLDGLYLNEKVLALCRRHRLAYIITFKEGKAPALYREMETLSRLQPSDSMEVFRGQTPRRYRWVNHLEHASHPLHAFECLEERSEEEPTRFLWVTNLEVTRANVEALSEEGGRCRWKIENEGFNTQKNGGYALEHAYCEDWTAAQNLYLAMQIAHLIHQLIEKGNLLKSSVRKLFGSVSAFVARLLEAWRTLALDPVTLQQQLATRFQIRLDSS